MEARIKPEINNLKAKMVFAVYTVKNGHPVTLVRKDSREEARQWATDNGYTLRYSG